MAFTEDLMNMFSPSEAEAAPGRSAMVNPKQSPTLGGQPISGFDTGKFVQSMLIKQLSEGLAEQKQQAASTAKQSDPMYQAKLKNEQMKGQPQDVQSLIGRGQPQADQGPQGPQMPVTFGRNPQTGVWSFNNQGYVDFPEDIQGQQEVPEWIRSNPRMREIAEAYASPKHQQLVEQIRNQHEMMQTASTPDGASALQGTIDPQKQATARANAAISLKGKMSDKEAEKFLDRQFPLTADIPTDATAENLQQFATPAELASMKKLATYDLPFTGRQGLNSPGMQRLVQGATILNPDFSVPQYQARQKLKVSFSSGLDKINIQSLNTVLPHIASLKEAGNALENSPAPFWNAIQNMGRNAIGDGRVGAFNFAAGRVADELERTFRGTAGNLAEIQDLRQSFSAANSPEQMKKTIDKAI